METESEKLWIKDSLIGGGGGSDSEIIDEAVRSVGLGNVDHAGLIREEVEGFMSGSPDFKVRRFSGAIALGIARRRASEFTPQDQMMPYEGKAGKREISKKAIIFDAGVVVGGGVCAAISNEYAGIAGMLIGSMDLFRRNIQSGNISVDVFKNLRNINK